MTHDQRSTEAEGSAQPKPPNPELRPNLGDTSAGTDASAIKIRKVRQNYGSFGQQKKLLRNKESFCASASVTFPPKLLRKNNSTEALAEVGFGRSLLMIQNCDFEP